LRHLANFSTWLSAIYIEALTRFLLQWQALGRLVSETDNTRPPVLFVVGTAGAGKSSLVRSLQRWARYSGTDVLAVNLDPGAERVHYDPEFDVRDLIVLSEVMNEYDLGPNGAQILAADLVAANADAISEPLDSLSGDLIVIDTPGQVELFAFREASLHLVEVLGSERAAMCYLFDPMLSQSPSGFVSQMLLSAVVHFRLGLPTANFLSKSDLLDEDVLERILEWSQRLEVLEDALYQESTNSAYLGRTGSARVEFAITMLRTLQQSDNAPGLKALSSEEEDGLADIMSFMQDVFVGGADTRDGFAEDLVHERDDWDGKMY